MFEHRGLDLGRMSNLMMEKRSIALPFEDPVTNAVNAAKPIIDALTDEQRDRIEIIVTSTESGIDYSKSIASYVHHYLGLSRNCRIVETKQACYAATAAVQMAMGYVASGMSPGGKALIIATDIALVDARTEYAEPAVGTGAAAVLISDQPNIIALDFGAFGNYSFETMDSARPAPEFDIADVDGSLFAYLDCLSASFQDYCSRVDSVDFISTFDYLALHTPFSGLVKAAHRKMMREFTHASVRQVEEDFHRRVAPSLAYPTVVGNLCSGSVYLALASMIDSAPCSRTSRVGLFSYGSGCSSEFFSGTIDSNSKASLAKMRIASHLDSRGEISFEEYLDLLKENLRCLSPMENREIDLARYDHFLKRTREERKILVWQGVKNYHREYQWH
jgi:polyketide biosynthesis 3-hydroxy-3-methylglutaryl-CoA synthase-like enzyme PksG